MIATRRDVLTASAAALLAGVGARAVAQGAPFDTVRLVTGFPPGGTSDTICRRVASKLAPGYGKSVVVENRVGAGGQIAVQSFKSLPPDGASILQTPMSMLGIYPHIYKKLQYDPVTDVMPVSLGATFDFGFAVGPAVPASVRRHPRVPRLVQGQPERGELRLARRRLGAALHRRADRPFGAASTSSTCPTAARSRPSWR